jgi:peptide/nickel transport system ATP-binding protein
MSATEQTAAEDVALKAVEASDLSVVYGQGDKAVHAVKGISFTVGDGETFGIVGESGSGKSTVLRVLAGLNRAWSGRLLIRGREAEKRRPRRSYRIVQMVFQDPYGSLHPRQTVERILLEGPMIQDMDDRHRRVQRVLYDVGLGKEFLYRYPHQLSGGQRQRVAIARALILEPRLLLLDEPTSALDVSVQAEILNLLRELRGRRRLSCILVSHNLAVVAHVCDRLIVMNEGRIVEQLEVASLRDGAAQHPYTRQLLRASGPYDRATAAGLVTYD